VTRDHKEDVGQDQFVTITRDQVNTIKHDRQLDVTHDQRTEVGNDYQLVVKGEKKEFITKVRHTEVNADETLTVTKSIKIHALEGDITISTPNAGITITHDGAIVLQGKYIRQVAEMIDLNPEA
jgi:type VI secretion system secreted protein VgrG